MGGAWGGRRVMAMREHWRLRLPAPCPRCGRPVTPDQAWDVGHILPIHSYPQLRHNIINTRPEHAACNRRDGARITRRRTRERQQARRDAGLRNW